MAVRSTALFLLAAMFVALATSASLYEAFSSNDMTREENAERQFLPDTKEKCALRRSRRLPSSMTIDISVIDTSYLDSLLKVEGAERRSLAPWDYRLNTDPNRFPYVIAEANCLTSACVDPDGKVNHDLISSPIQQEIMVLRREQKDCKQIYRLETQLVTLGCTCARPIVSEEWPLSDLY